ncbi:MAG: non-ribosomal peptide synthetase, partial [Bdellovibrionota bacterium]
FLSIDGHAIAVKDRGRDFTYGELAARAREFSGLLRARGVRPGDRVAICAKHSFDTVAAILGTWYLGAAFVPLDPEWPPERIRFVLRDCAPACVVAENFPDMPFVALREPGPQDANPPAPARLAYLIYTSGSTGEPKGVEVGHESLANYLQWAREVYSPGAPPVYPLFTPLTFDLTITALLVPLVAGGAVKVVAETEPASAARAILRDREINCVKLTPSHLRLFTEINGGAVKIYVVGGEALDATLASRAAHGARVFNEYGPTEATVGCVVHEFVPGDEIVPIGKPIANTEVLLLDEKGGAVSPGGVGEIYLSGACLALGYRGRPFENHRFSPHPFRPGERVYRTGDLARLNSNGNFEYLGRADDQMKILGHRVEPGEVEAALLATKLCREAAVLAVNGHLAAYVSGVDDAGALEAAAAAVLPRWMRPAEFVSLVRLPLNQNGKVDKKKLAPPSAMPERLAEAASSLEETLRGIAAEQMGRAPGTISVRRSLHELGFDSLQLALLLTRASHLLPEGAPRDGLFTDLHGFLREPSLARLAEHLRGLGVAG